MLALPFSIFALNWAALGVLVGLAFPKVFTMIQPPERSVPGLLYSGGLTLIAVLAVLACPFKLTFTIISLGAMALILLRRHEGPGRASRIGKVFATIEHSKEGL